MTRSKTKEYSAPPEVYGYPESIREWADKVIASWGLTPTEKRCLELLLKGCPDKEIAETLGNSQKTIKHHLHTVRMKSHCGSRSEIFAEILRL